MILGGLGLKISVLCCAVLFLRLTFSPVESHAGCCPAGPPTVYRDYTGAIDVYVGGGVCRMIVESCTVVVYNYKWCEDGPTEVPSFDVYEDGTCFHYFPFICMDTGYYRTPAPGGGNYYTCTRTCPHPW
ncbi:MAG TPA: hypothetical protein ENO21_01255 [Firmicutes bacterium]|nr:hypothetical protein [Bacillota bacterium]